MSKKTDDFEKAIARAIAVGSQMPDDIPAWMEDLGIVGRSKVTNICHLGSSGGKTDILIEFDNAAQLKISAKLNSADYYGNWYSHDRLIREFGEEIFYKIVNLSTDWANNWVRNDNASFFIGVSISFGKRTGNTGSEFLDVFSIDDIIKIVAGSGEIGSVSNANCLLVTDFIPKNLEELVQKLHPINIDTIQKLSKNFKVIYRPVNPMTEGTNRGKCIYTRFEPFDRSDNLVEINSCSDLLKYGKFVPVESNSLNHNRHIKDLKERYNILVPTKNN